MQKNLFLKKLGIRIREIRLKKGLSQVELASSIGKDQQSIQRLKRGNINPSIFYLNQVSEGLNVELDELVKKL